MSAISSVGSATPSLLQQAQQRRARPDGDHQGSGFAAQMKSRFETAAKAAGADESKLPDLEKQIQDAIAKATADGSGDRSAVRDAIDGVLKQNGVDVAKFRSAMNANRGHHGRGKAAASAAGADPTGGCDSTGDPTQPGAGALIDIAA